ncbi:hypothetical protein, conserved [Eimeria necatrix]|uniref:Uncharacterized protein n=1 Tax=Eimeria necatrix TaxID=51315 RepID=U6MYL2_9EIME|nr:hypothetical protein, conserved [Eimeria necatrix]CDJ68128.1 hypothetical protein, conserved [Eimeria necatrix]
MEHTEDSQRGAPLLGGPLREVEAPHITSAVVQTSSALSSRHSSAPTEPEASDTGEGGPQAALQRSASASSGGTAATGYPLESPLLADAGGHIRSCFICLEGPRKGRRGAPPKLLHPCCSQCYAVVHEKCWTAYRRRQRLAAFRARLLGHRAPDTSRCSICRTGRGALPPDVCPQGPPQPVGEGATDLQEQLLASLARLLMDDDGPPSHPFCSGFCACFNAVVFVSFFLVGFLLVAFAELKGVTVFLLSLFLYYHFILFQLIFLAIRQRREALSALPPSPQAFSNDSPPPPADPANPPGGSSASSGEENHSTSSSSSGTPGVPLGDAVGGLSATEVTERGLSNEAGSGYSHWLSFLWRRGARDRDALNANIAAPFLSGAALVVEMRMMRTETLPA